MYRTELMEAILKSPAAWDIINELSPIYGEARVALWLFQVIGAELDETRKWTQEVEAQTVPQTATWSIGMWEDSRGLPRAPNLDLQSRRDRVVANMNYRAPMNPWKMEKIATAAASGAKCTVKERTGKGSVFTVSVDLTKADRTVPMDAIWVAVNEAKQARLSFLVEFEIKHAIEIGRKIESWTFCPPLCGTIRCGTWWMPSTLGWSTRAELQLADRSGYYAVSPEFTGTLPDVATPGWSVCGAVLCGGWADSYTAAPAEANTADCGTLWMPSTLGWSESQQVQAEGQVDCIAVQPELTGTLPDAATQGYSICGATACGGAAKGYKVSPKLTGTLPRKEGEDE